VHDAAPRDRLFARLEEERLRRSALCVVGPPGAGKTTLVASWLDSRQLDGIWYQVDPGDSDLATFFYHLRLAATPFSRKGLRAMPLLTPEYLPDIEGFARRFFRDLFMRLPEGAVLVLDNYQEVPADQQFHAIVALAIDEIPRGLTLFAISRRDPPACYARLIANENASLIEWEELRLSRQEAHAISAKRATLTEQEFETLYRASDGWAAGLALMLERLKRNGIVPEAMATETREAVFNYFAGVIFERLPVETRHVCLTTALLPQVTARGAELVSGVPEAARLLERLYRERLFTDRRMIVPADPDTQFGSESLVATYQYHPLFRAFLLDLGQVVWTSEVRERWLLNAVSLLELSGQHSDAIAILIEIAQWTRAADLIVAQAPRLIAQGRWQTLHGWLQAVPDERLREAPWLVYWWGVSRLAVDQQDACRLFERSHVLMEATGDVLGQLQSAAGVIEGLYYRWSSFTEMDRWITVIQALLESGPAFGAAYAELHVNSSLLIALSYRQPGNPLLPRCVARVTELLEAEIDVNQRATAGTFLLGYCYFAADYDLAKRVIAMIEPLLTHADVTPLVRLWWRARIGYYAYHIADYPRALGALDEAAGILRSHGLAGLHSAEPLLAFFRTLAALGDQDLATAQESVQALRRLANPQHRFAMWYLQIIESVLALRAGALPRSLEMAEASIRTAIELGMHYVRQLSLTLTTHVLVRMGRCAEALQGAAEAKSLAEGTVMRNLAAEPMFVEAYVALRGGDHALAVALARAAFEASRRTHYAFWFRFMPDVLPEVCALALSEGIEPSYVGEVIRRYAIAPVRPFVRHWPWPLQVSTLGAFAIAKAGVPIDLSKSVTRKPMELLKGIIALGVEGVPVATLIDHLWPDAEGDAAQKTFAITLHRLRRQLGDDHAIVMKAGTVGIDLRSCWVDVAAFVRMTLDEEVARVANTHSVDALHAAIGDLKALYRGAFVPGEVSESWVLVSRQRLHTRFLATVLKWGAALEESGDTQGAAALYGHALSIDGCAERVCQRLMRCLGRADKAAEVEDAFRLYSDALSATGRSGPSAETEALYRSLRPRERAPSRPRTQ
jgi:ATP/maltotriose-dependent transcriptional regulator MalT/DNA-binding SARP family transcriptional activator